jgi:hypothetical protein
MSMKGSREGLHFPILSCLVSQELKIPSIKKILYSRRHHVFLSLPCSVTRALLKITVDDISVVYVLHALGHVKNSIQDQVLWYTD